MRLCALTYFMRNPKNWTLEFNTPILNNGSAEDREDLHFQIGVEPVSRQNTCFVMLQAALFRAAPSTLSTHRTHPHTQA
eukprot:5183692-Amphidinium_carterae.1